MDSERDKQAADVQFSLEVAAERGSYRDAETPAEVRRLADEGMLREAFELVAGTATEPPKEDMFWLHVGLAAEGLGLRERAAFYHAKYEAANSGHSAYYGRLLEQIQALVVSDCTVPDGMRQVIDFCSAAKPHDDWPRFSAIDYAADVGHFSGWAETVFTEAGPDDSVTALWFGISNAIYDERSTADLYVSGGIYHPDLPDEWAERPTWRAGGAKPRSAALDAIYRLAYPGTEEQLGNAAEYALCLTYSALLVRWLATTRTGLLLGAASERLLETGFDEGTVLRIGTLHAGGLAYPDGGMLR